MKIALFPSAFYPSLGGVEELSLRLAQTLEASGHRVRVYTERWPRNLSSMATVEGIEVRRFAYRVPDARGLKPKLSWALRRGPTQRYLEADLRDFGPDLVNVQCVSSAVDYAMPAARKLGIPFVATLQGELSMDANGIYQRPGGGQRRMLQALRKADAITACSRQTLKEAEAFHIEHGGAPFGDRGRVIYNGIDLESFEGVKAVERDRPYVFALGRHVQQKGFDVLLRAMADVPTTHNLLLAGDGPEQEALMALASELGLASRVDFVGRLDAAGVRSYMKGASVFVLPSRHEPFGIVNLEAMASGIPVVASRVGGVPEFVEDGVAGVLVEAEDATGLAKAIGELLRDREQARRLAEVGRERAQGFDWHTIAQSYLEAMPAAMEVTAP